MTMHFYPLKIVCISLKFSTLGGHYGSSKTLQHWHWPPHSHSNKSLVLGFDPCHFQSIYVVLIKFSPSSFGCTWHGERFIFTNLRDKLILSNLVKPKSIHHCLEKQGKIQNKGLKCPDFLKYESEVAISISKKGMTQLAEGHFRPLLFSFIFLIFSFPLFPLLALSKAGQGCPCRLWRRRGRGEETE